MDLGEKYGVERGIHLSYLPLPHIMERLINLVNLQRGSLIGFWCNDRETLIEDMQMIKPIMFVGVPRIHQKIQDKILNGINSSSFIVRKLFEYGYKKKLNSLNNRQEPSKFFEKIFAKINAAFGGNIQLVMSGAAPLSQETAEFLKVIFGGIGEGYGLTETCASGTGTHEFDLKYGHVGM